MKWSNVIYQGVKQALTRLFTSSVFKKWLIIQVNKLIAKNFFKLTGIQGWVLDFVLTRYGKKLAKQIALSGMLAYDIKEGKFKVRSLKDAKENNDESKWDYIIDDL